MPKNYTYCLIQLIAYLSPIFAYSAVPEWAWEPACEGVSNVVYVNKSATGNNTGFNWTNACHNLQSALELARDCEGVTEIWVAEGTYYPDSTDREETFELLDGVSIYGGFQGVESSKIESDPAENLTILSGDINIPNSSDDNSYNVLVAKSINEITTLYGLIIEKGNASGEDEQETQGAGLWAENANLIIERCEFRQCSARDRGAAIFAKGGNSLVFDKLYFGFNTSDGDGGAVYIQNGLAFFRNTLFDANKSQASGGAVFAQETDARFVEGDFLSNTAEGNGGGLSLVMPTDVWMANVRFIKNDAAIDGGGIYTQNLLTSFWLVNAEFIWNNANGDGGAISARSSEVNILNATFAQNSAAINGGAISIGAFDTDPPQTTHVLSSIFWGNIAGNFENHLDALNNDDIYNVKYSLIFGGFPGEGNIDDEPYFVDYPSKDDDNLGDLRLTFESPAINAGSPEPMPNDVIDLDEDSNITEPISVDLDGKSRVLNNRVDMGAFEFSSGESPTAINLAPDTVRENKPINTVVGQLTAEDPDDTDGFIFDLVRNHPDNAFFKLAGNVLVTGISFNYEIKNEYTLLIRVTDPRGNTFEQEVKVFIINDDDLPTFQRVADTVMVLEDSPTENFEGFITEIEDEDDDLGNVFVRFDIIANDHPEYFSTLPEITPEGILAFQPAPNEFGTAQLMFELTVGETKTEPDTFYIEILPVNDAPTATTVGRQEVDMADGSATLSVFDILPGPLNENAQSLTFEVSYRPLGPIADATHDFDPATNTLDLSFLALEENQTVNCSILVRDDGGTEYGGVDTLRINFQIDIINTLERPVFLPDLFSPNNDGNNDFFRLLGGGGVSEIQLAVFDKNGTMVFFSDNFEQLSSTGWDGKFKGLQQPSGTYFWQITGKYYNGDPIKVEGKETGTLVLMR